MNYNNNINNTKKVMKDEKRILKGQLKAQGLYTDMTNPDNIAIFNIIHLNYGADDFEADDVVKPNVALTPEAFNGYIQAIPTNLLKMLLAMVKHIDSEGFCYPSVDTIAKDAGIGRSTAFEYLKKYANKKINGVCYLFKKPEPVKRGKGLQDINLYYIPYCRTIYADTVGEVEAEDIIFKDVPVPVHVPTLSNTLDNNDNTVTFNIEPVEAVPEALVVTVESYTIDDVESHTEAIQEPDKALSSDTDKAFKSFLADVIDGEAYTAPTSPDKPKSRLKRGKKTSQAIVKVTKEQVADEYRKAELLFS